MGSNPGRKVGLKVLNVFKDIHTNSLMEELCNLCEDCGFDCDDSFDCQDCPVTKLREIHSEING